MNTDVVAMLVAAGLVWILYVLLCRWSNAAARRQTGRQAARGGSGIPPYPIPPPAPGYGGMNWRDPIMCEQLGIIPERAPGPRAIADFFIRDAYVRRFGSDVGWLDARGDWYVEGYLAGQVSAAACTPVMTQQANARTEANQADPQPFIRGTAREERRQ